MPASGSKDPIARKMRLRRRRDQEEADQDQAKILKVRCERDKRRNGGSFESFHSLSFSSSGYEGYGEGKE